MFNLSFLTIVLAVSIISAEEPDCTKESPHVELKQCCKYADLITPSILQKCESFKRNGETNDSKKPLFNKCFMECALNETGIMQSLPDIKVDAAKLKAFLGATFSGDDADIIPIIEEAFITCAAEGQEIKEKMKTMTPPPAKENECKPIAGGLMGCAFMKTLMGCPTAKWSNSDECNNFKSRFAVCGKEMHKH